MTGVVFSNLSKYIEIGQIMAPASVKLEKALSDKAKVVQLKKVDSTDSKKRKHYS